MNLPDERNALALAQTVRVVTMGHNGDLSLCHVLMGDSAEEAVMCPGKATRLVEVEDLRYPVPAGRSRSATRAVACELHASMLQDEPGLLWVRDWHPVVPKAGA